MARAGGFGQGGVAGEREQRADSTVGQTLGPRAHTRARSSAESRGSGSCFHCNEKGHYSRVCPKLQSAGINKTQFEQLQGPGHAKQAARQALESHKRAVSLNAISHPGGGQPTNATLELRDQVAVLSDEYNKLFNQFSVANSRLDSSADGSSD